MHQDIIRLLKEGRSAAEIAEEVGCSKKTVYRDRKTLEGDLSPSKVERTADELEQRLDEGCEQADGIPSNSDVLTPQGLNQAEGLAAAENEDGTRNRSRLGAEKHRDLARLLEAGCDPATIAAKVGCGIATVYRERRFLELARLNKSLGRNPSEPAAAVVQQTLWAED